MRRGPGSGGCALPLGAVADASDGTVRLRGVVVSGTARVHARNQTFRRIRRRLYAKYPQYPVEAALDDHDSIVVEVTPRWVFTWGFD